MFISNAYAQAAAGAGGLESSLTSFLPIILMFVVLYFVMIRPQMKRQKEARAMIEALAKGDEVATAGGLLGRITSLGDQYLGLEIANGVEIRVQRTAVVQVLPKGAIKSAVSGRPFPTRHCRNIDAIMNRYPVWKYAILVIVLLVKPTGIFKGLST